MSEQNIEFSSDENSLIIKSGKLDGEYQAVKSESIQCGNCSFWQFDVGCNLGGAAHAKCVPHKRLDKMSIVWQKVKPKQDDKKATAVFSNDENCLIIKSGKFAGEYQTKKDDSACVDCAFDHSFGCSIGGMLNAHCSPQTRKDGKSIIWIKKENTEMTEAPAPVEARAHAELIKQWASDKSLKVFVWYKNAWGDISEPAWYKSENYAVGHEKPTEPLVKMVKAPALQHRHFDLIVAWAKNPTQPVWFWNVDEWEKAANPIWHMEHYVIGEKPTMPPVKMVKYDGGSIEFPEPARVELKRDGHYWAVTIYGADPDYWTGHSSDFELLDNGLIQLTKEGAEKQSEALVELLKNHAQKWG